jgi:hypothetical protein
LEHGGYAIFQLLEAIYGWEKALFICASLLIFSLILQFLAANLAAIFRRMFDAPHLPSPQKAEPTSERSRSVGLVLAVVILAVVLTLVFVVLPKVAG